jgi:hypothetical protein
MTPRELLQVHTARSLAQYLHTLEYVDKVSREGNLKDADAVEVQKYVEQLKQYLSDKGTPEDDQSLLQFAIQVPGRQRGIHPPLALLGPRRGGFSKARLEEAAGQVERVREALSAGTRLMGPLNSDAAIACAELAATIRRFPIEDNSIAAHADLTPEETGELVGSAIALLDKQQAVEAGVAVGILNCLANFRSDGLGQYAAALLDRGLLRPPTLYRDAPDAVAHRLTEDVPKAEGRALNDLLLALAWTRGKVAQEAFFSWKNSPQPWAAPLRGSIAEYAYSAGWTFDLRGNRRELFSTSCHAIIRQAKSGSSATAVPCRVPTDEHCPGCKHTLAWLFDFSNIGTPFWPPDRAEAPRRVLFCPACAHDTTVYSRYRPDGSSEWHPANELEASDGEADRPPCNCELLASPRPAFAAQSFALREESCLGGAPVWLDDAVYPRCPDCKEAMKFLAQFVNSTVQPEEGIYYAFFCDACRVAAVNYQQT